LFAIILFVTSTTEKRWKQPKTKKASRLLQRRKRQGFCQEILQKKNGCTIFKEIDKINQVKY